MEHIASLSYGKDSLYMLELIHRNGLPLDRIVHAEIMATPTISADLPPMMDFKEKADAIILEKYGIVVEHIKSAFSYEERFYKTRVGKKTKPENVGKIYGFPIVLGAWCNRDLKMNVLGRFNKKNIHQYVGYAIDEKKKERQEKIQLYLSGQSDFNGSYPLVDYNVTEDECLNWCKENDLLSPIYETSTRGGCWFCHNSTLQNLYDLKVNYPDYWKLMLKWDSDSPVIFRTDGITIHDLDERFEAGFVYKREYNKFLKNEERMMKMNKNLLVSKMKLHGDTNASLAEKVGCSPQRFSAKINGTNGAEFTQGEIQTIRDSYNLTNDEVTDIFFT